MVLSALFLTVFPGKSLGGSAWLTGKIKCLKCSGLIKAHSGVICANYGLRQHKGRLCLGAWHGKCFYQHEDDNYPVLGMQDLDDALIRKEDSADNNDIRFKEGRDGAHLMTLFQCVECHFINIKGRRMDSGNSRDQLAKIAITRAILDSLWARERFIINGNRLEGARLMQEDRTLGFQEDLYPMRGPFPKGDIWGMQLVCAMLGRSLDSGGKTPRSFSLKPLRRCVHIFRTLFTPVRMAWEQCW